MWLPLAEQGPHNTIHHRTRTFKPFSTFTYETHDIKQLIENSALTLVLAPSAPSLCLTSFLVVSQKYEKPKFVQCLVFLSTGDILTGDSGGILLVWTRNSAETPTGKGPRGQTPLPRLQQYLENMERVGEEQQHFGLTPDPCESPVAAVFSLSDQPAAQSPRGQRLLHV